MFLSCYKSQKMNIKFILLSICLTLEVTKIVANGIFSGILNAIGAADTIMTVTDLIQDKDQVVIDLLETLLKDAEQMSFGLSDQVD